MFRILVLSLMLALVSTAAFAGDEPPEETVVAEAKVDTAALALKAAVDEVFAASCVGCHGATRPAAGLSLTPELLEKATIEVASTQVESLNLVQPGVPAKSYLLMKIMGADGIMHSRMPTRGEPLGVEAEKAVGAWIFAMRTAPPKKPVEPPPPEKVTHPPKKKVATKAEDIVPPPPPKQPAEPETESEE